MPSLQPKLARHGDKNLELKARATPIPMTCLMTEMTQPALRVIWSELIDWRVRDFARMLTYRSILIQIILLVLLTLPATAQAPVRPFGYEEAAGVFHGLDVDSRVRLQLLLTAAGVLASVPNENFNGRIFRAISDFQGDNGFTRTGGLTQDQFDRLLTVAAPNLNHWGLRAIAHPQRGRSIWVPMGLGLVSERTKEGLTFRDPGKRLVLHYEFLERESVRRAFDVTLKRMRSQGRVIHYRVLRDDLFAISSSLSDGTDSYWRYHQDGTGLLGFRLAWNNAHGDVHAERIATLVSGSLWSAMTGARFAELPVIKDSVVMARPTLRPEIPSTSPTPAPSTPATNDKPKPEEKQRSSGTGFFITENGHVLTTAHVVEDCPVLRVTAEGQLPLPGRIVAKDAANDLAVLATDLKPSKIACIRTGVRLGEQVAAFGFPLAPLLSQSGNFTLGNVTALAGLRDDTRYIQMSTPVQAGNSGGPLFDFSGNVVGVVKSKLNVLRMAVVTGDFPQNVNFALKATVATSFLESNRISYIAASSMTPIAPADLADHSRSVSVFIECASR